MAEYCFWGSVLILAYAFVGYPLLLQGLGKLWGRKDVSHDDSGVPSVSILLSAYNEEAILPDKIRNFEALEYPPELIELLVISDGSTDRTVEIAEQWGNPRVRVLVQPENIGKTMALNRAATEARGDILVFTDANSMFDPDAVSHLASRFADPEVGLASGHSVYESASGGEGAYRRYEDAIKTLESRLWGIPGADGAIYAMRRELYTPLKPEYINDFIHPLQVIMQGRRAVQETRAVCREAFEVEADELRRQIRIMTQSWIVVTSQVPLLLRAGKWGFVWQLVTHKLLRWLTLPLMALALLANIPLVPDGGLYAMAFAVQLAFYLSAAGFRLGRADFGRLPYGFIALHLAPVIGLARFMTGEQYVSWKPRNS